MIPKGYPITNKATAELIGNMERPRKQPVKAVLRPVMLEAWESTVEIGRGQTADKPRGLVLTGLRGRGKSAALAYCVHRARAEGWIAVYVREAYDWVKTQAIVPPCPLTEGEFRLPDVEYDLMVYLRDGNGARLAANQVTTASAKAAGDKTLMDTVSRAIHGLDEDAVEYKKTTARAVEDVFNELAAVKGPGVLVAIDEVNYLFHRTAYQDRRGLPVLPGRLAPVRLLTRLAASGPSRVGVSAVSYSPELQRTDMPARTLEAIAKEWGVAPTRLEVDVLPEEFPIMATCWQAQNMLSYVPTNRVLGQIYNQAQRDLPRAKNRIDAWVASVCAQHLDNPFTVPKEALAQQ
jgi:hypothetical protein